MTIAFVDFFTPNSYFQFEAYNLRRSITSVIMDSAQARRFVAEYARNEQTVKDIDADLAEDDDVKKASIGNYMAVKNRNTREVHLSARRAIALEDLSAGSFTNTFDTNIF